MDIILHFKSYYFFVEDIYIHIHIYIYIYTDLAPQIDAIQFSEGFKKPNFTQIHLLFSQTLTAEFFSGSAGVLRPFLGGVAFRGFSAP